MFVYLSCQTLCLSVKCLQFILLHWFRDVNGGQSITLAQAELSSVWNTMTFYTDIHGPQRINDFGDSLKIPLAPLAGQSFNLSHEISQHVRRRLA